MGGSKAFFSASAGAPAQLVVRPLLPSSWRGWWHSWILDPGSEVAGTRSDKCGVYCVWMDGAAAASGSGHSSCTSLDETRRDESRSITSLYYFSILLYPDTSLYVSIVSIRVYTCLSKTPSTRYPFGNVTPIACDGGVVIRRTSDSDRCSELAIVLSLESRSIRVYTSLNLSILL